MSITGPKFIAGGQRRGPNITANSVSKVYFSLHFNPNGFSYLKAWRCSSAMEDGKRDLVVVVGGSGYLGLHLLAELAKCQAHKYRVAYTYHSQPPSPQLQQHLPNVKSFQVDLVTGHGLDSISSALGFVSHHPSAYVWALVDERNP